MPTSGQSTRLGLETRTSPRARGAGNLEDRRFGRHQAASAEMLTSQFTPN